MEKIAIVTDAWHPQINGVVTTLSKTIQLLEDDGHKVEAITPQLFRSIACPTYPEISLALTRAKNVEQILLKFSPTCVHIATEGPLGWAARSICRKRQFSFTTSYHTRFPEYVRMRWPIPLTLSYTLIKHFHKAAGRTMVATTNLIEELTERGFNNLVQWSRGVDTDLFKPPENKVKNLENPTFIYVGRVAVEKNIETFLRLDLPGKKVVVGDGPAKKELAEKYPKTLFTGYKKGKELAALVASSDVFVFPSLTDTFGVVLLEAMATGVPVAAFPVTGPLESVHNGMNGYLDTDLKNAALKALHIPSENCREYALQRTWSACTNQFKNNLIAQTSLS